MNRKIKFRAKFIMGIHKGEWDYFTLGDLMETPSENFESWYDIKTLGEYVGLIDKKNKEIYEGDIIIFDYDIDTKSIIEFKNGTFGIEENTGIALHHRSFGCLNIRNMKVIGNKHDNLKLLKK